MPEITDAAYDKLCRRAEDLTGRFPILTGIVKKLNGKILLNFSSKIKNSDFLSVDLLLLLFKNRLSDYCCEINSFI
jgi:NAD-dependent DNA ligase